MERSVAYTLRFTAIVAVVASAVVSASAMALGSRQEANRLHDRRLKVLEVVGLYEPGEQLSRVEVERRFEENLRPLAVHLATGTVAQDVDLTAFDQQRASRDPATSSPAPENAAGVSRLPDHVLVHHLVRDGDILAVVLPFEGGGLWSTIYGFVALSADLARVRGITFYEHAETAGLGARISDVEWRSLWEGRRLFDDEWEPVLRVVKGRVGPAALSPYEVDGLSGATLTGNGVTEALHFWLGDAALGAYLRRYRTEEGISE